ncbi:MAG: thioredoxin TrxA [Phycisphaerales bacterium]
MASANVKEFTDDNFQSEVIESDAPVVVDFWAEWCQPCRLLSPTIDKIADEYDGKVKVGKVNIDQHQKTSVDFKVTAIPTVLVIKNGEVQEKFVGMTNEGDLKAAIDKHL